MVALASVRGEEKLPERQIFVPASSKEPQLEKEGFHVNGTASGQLVV